MLKGRTVHELLEGEDEVCCSRSKCSRAFCLRKHHQALVLMECDPMAWSTSRNSGRYG